MAKKQEKKAALVKQFLDAAHNPEPGYDGPYMLSEFEQELKWRFDHHSDERASTKQICKILKKLQLPVPQDNNEFLHGRDGVLLFLNSYGVVIRIETKISDKFKTNDSDWVLKPLAIFQAGEAVIEICPGLKFESDRENAKIVKRKLNDEGYKAFDALPRNLGRLPFPTPEFPKGMPIIVDRPAIRLLNNSVKKVADALPKKPSPQDILFDPLKKAFQAAWPDGADAPDAAKMKQFWKLCKQFVKEKKLNAGWNDCPFDSEHNFWEYEKTNEAKKAAKTYGSRTL